MFLRNTMKPKPNSSINNSERQIFIYSYSKEISEETRNQITELVQNCLCMGKNFTEIQHTIHWHIAGLLFNRILVSPRPDGVEIEIL